MSGTDVTIPSDRQELASWRDVLPIHAAAALFPLMGAAELKALAEDIVKNGGLQIPLILFKEQKHFKPVLLDGRNRLAALELVGFTFQVESIGTDGDPQIRITAQSPQGKFLFLPTHEVRGDHQDPFDFIISINIHRRHLTAEQKRELIATVIQADPSKSDRQIAEMVKASPTTVGTVRAEMELTVQIGQLPKRVGKDGKSRAQPNGVLRIHRAMKLGVDTVAALRGTALDSAREMDALIRLDRGAPEGGHTPEVTRLVAAATAGVDVSAVDYIESGAAFRREDVGPTSSGETARKDAEIEELRNAKRMLEIKIAGLESETEELKAQVRGLEDRWLQVIPLAPLVDELQHRLPATLLKKHLLALEALRSALGDRHLGATLEHEPVASQVETTKH